MLFVIYIIILFNQKLYKFVNLINLVLKMVEHKSEVKFNQAGYQQERINDLMRVINLCWINPTQYNYQFNDFNYRVIFRVLTSYYSEIRVKLKTEREEIDKIMNALNNYIETNPIVTNKKQASMFSSNTKTNFNSASWVKISKALFLYQNKILDAAESHGMGNPTIKDPSKAAIDM